LPRSQVTTSGLQAVASSRIRRLRSRRVSSGALNSTPTIDLFSYMAASLFNKHTYLLSYCYTIVLQLIPTIGQFRSLVLHVRLWNASLPVKCCHTRAHDVSSKQQHGFLSRRCTDSNLLECLNDWTFALHLAWRLASTIHCVIKKIRVPPKISVLPLEMFQTLHLFFGHGSRSCSQ